MIVSFFKIKKKSLSTCYVFISVLLVFRDIMCLCLLAYGDHVTIMMLFISQQHRNICVLFDWNFSQPTHRVSNISFCL